MLVKESAPVLNLSPLNSSLFDLKVIDFRRLSNGLGRAGGMGLP